MADRYVATGNVAAVVLAGSIGRGRADAFSDVELDVYWVDPPSDHQRRVPAGGLGGDVTQLWAYDADDAEWAEDVHVLGVDVTVSGFTCRAIDEWIASLAADSDADLVRQMRLSALQEGEILHGEDCVRTWRSTGSYPRSLAMATAVHFLDPSRLNRWRLWRALVHRDDLVMLHQACSDAVAVILGSLCAVNRIYIEHPSFKWSRHLASRFTRAPDSFADRLFAALDAGTVERASELDALLIQTVEIVRSDLPEVDLSLIEGILRSER